MTATVWVTTGAKGGAGKTAIAMNAAYEAYRRGKRVLLVDADPRGVAFKWSRVAAHRGVDGPACIGVGDDVRERVLERADDYDLIVIDTEGKVGKRLSRALRTADLALLPVKPETGDIWVLGESIELVRDAQRVNRRLQARLVLCCAVSTRIARAAAQAIAQAALPSTSCVLRQSTVYTAAQNEGRGVTEMYQDHYAATQIRELVDELEQVAGGIADVA